MTLSKICPRLHPSAYLSINLRINWIISRIPCRISKIIFVQGSYESLAMPNGKTRQYCKITVCYKWGWALYFTLYNVSTYLGTLLDITCLFGCQRLPSAQIDYIFHKAQRTVRLNNKIPPKIRLKKVVTLHWLIILMLATIWQILKMKNLKRICTCISVVWITLRNHIKLINFWPILAIWNHCSVQRRTYSYFLLIDLCQYDSSI